MKLRIVSAVLIVLAMAWPALVADAGPAGARVDLQRLLTGNTLLLTTPRGRNAFEYFAANGRAPLAIVGGRRFEGLRWHIDEAGRLCRTENGARETCLRAIVRGKTIVLQAAGGQLLKAVLLQGNQMPK